MSDSAEDAAARLIATAQARGAQRAWATVDAWIERNHKVALTNAGVLLWSEFRATREGCYICQPDNPDAAEEGCSRCEREFWASVIPPEKP